jgi:hypothetical protein
MCLMTGMRNRTDKLKVQFVDKNTMDVWRFFDQLTVGGVGAGGTDTWDPGSPTHF